MSATEQFCTFFLNGVFFGVPVALVQEVFRDQAMTPVPRAPPMVSGLINLRGQIVTAVDLRYRMGFPPREKGKRHMNVVVRTGDGVMSLIVDEIGDVVTVDRDDFEPPPARMSGPGRELVQGVYKLEDRLLLTLCPILVTESLRGD